MKKAPDTTKAASSAPDAAQFTGTELLELAYTAIENAALRAWCAAPSSWGRGTIQPKPKGPVLENTFGQAVATPTDKRGFVMFRFLELVRLHWPRMVFGHGGGYPQGRPHGLSRVFNHHAHPLRVKTQRVVLKSRQGATMHPTPVASASARTPITLPTKGAPATPRTDSEEARAFALLQATSDATMAKLYLARGNVPAARRKAVQLLKALQLLEVASASACTHCRDNFPLPEGPLDFFDTHATQDSIQRRSACTLRPAASKPCLKGGAA